jgi:uncharacterized protein (DUF1697 family)
MTERYVAFLRGINLGRRRATNEGLAAIFGGLGLTNVKTLIASGNVVFDADVKSDETALTKRIEDELQAGLGFSVDTMLRSMSTVEALLDRDPFKGIEVTKQTRRYITLLAAPTNSELALPHDHLGGALRIVARTDREVFSVLTLTEGSRTVDAMSIIEREYGRRATTRNWNTIQKLRGL